MPTLIVPELSTAVAALIVPEARLVIVPPGMFGREVMVPDDTPTFPFQIVPEAPKGEISSF